MSKEYRGRRLESGACVVEVHAGGEVYLLPERRDLISFTADGFNWGHQGSGPTQLALAILADHHRAAIRKPGIADDAAAIVACQYCYRFRRLFIEPVTKSEWSIAEADVDLAMKEFYREDHARASR